jgi:predicted permease
MKWAAYVAEAFNALFRRKKTEKELNEEVSFHLEMEIEKNVRAGMSREEARRVARVRFGGVEQVKEEVREERGVKPLEDLLIDLRYALRQVRRSPGFAAVAILTLALGIGANTALFSVLRNVILTPLGYDQPQQLVRLYQAFLENPDGKNWVSGAAFLDYREQLDGLESAAAIYNYRDRGFTLTGFGPPRRVSMMLVSSDFFQVYHTYPVIGRGFYREEERGSARIAVISHRLWTALSGGDAGILQQRLILDGDAFEVVGVMPEDFVDVVGGDVDLWIPLELQDQNATQNRGNHYLSVVARLRPDVSLGEAQAQLEALSRSQAEMYRGHEDWTARFYPLHGDLVGNTSTMLFVLLGASGLVLLIACVNVASLFIARNIVREREIALRAALGAGKFRLTRQLLTESLVVGLFGGLAGLAVAYWGMSALLPLSSDALPRAHEVSFDAALFAFALGVSLFTVLIFGLAPALQFTSPNLDQAIRENPRTSTGGTRSKRMRDVLVTSQIALALVLLVGAGLLMRSLLNLQRVDLGIGSHNVMTFEVHLGGTRYTDAENRIAFQRNFQDRLRERAGVEAVGAVSKLPVSDVYNTWSFSYMSPEGEVLRHQGWADFRIIEGDYFEALDIRLLSGRRFESTDVAGATEVAIINERAAELFFEGRDPLGQLIAADRRWTVVGVAEDVAHDHRGNANPMVYLSHTQFGDDRSWALSQVASTTLPRRDLVAATRQVLAAIDPELVVHNVRSMRDVKAGAIAREQFAVLLLGLFAAMALSLAVVGIYGVMAYNVSRRAQEFGIRLAMGASPGKIRRSVFLHGALMVGMGIAVGLAGAFALARLMGSMLFGVSTADPLTFLAVPVTLVLATLLAGYIPARRATSVDPVDVLRYE